MPSASTRVRTSIELRTPLLLTRAFAGARGVTLRAVLAYVAVWALIGGVSRFSMSALGLYFAPPGSSSLDTVAVVFMLLPAAALANSTASRVPELEAVRSRVLLVAQCLWLLAIVGAATIVPWATSFTLSQAVDRNSYFSTWLLVLSAMLVVHAVTTTMVASMVAMSLVAAFSTPGLVPWEYNLIYNLAEKGLAAGVGIVLLLIWGSLQVAQHTRQVGIPNPD
ncbi:hypothetical protein D2L64_17705 [Micromonospora radicis]|uniref:Uncharacterized protein n=1 Tax=Micromonospora radicis TaxID=1894971 RepID=A0A418MSL3_9ACTN|nr:hypothetical protein D2L64_17705 [Micromonospora radicis]